MIRLSGFINEVQNLIHAQFHRGFPEVTEQQGKTEICNESIIQRQENVCYKAALGF